MCELKTLVPIQAIHYRTLFFRAPDFVRDFFFSLVTYTG